MIVKINDLLDIYNNEILKGVKNRKKILAFEKCKIEYLVYIKNILENGLYQGSYYNIFLDHLLTLYHLFHHKVMLPIKLSSYYTFLH